MTAYARPTVPGFTELPLPASITLHAVGAPLDVDGCAIDGFQIAGDSTWYGSTGTLSIQGTMRPDPDLAYNSKDWDLVAYAPNQSDATAVASGILFAEFPQLKLVRVLVAVAGSGTPKALIRVGER
jgi:hypothetical protein